MSSDADYMSFLDKANEDPSSGTTHTSSSNSKPQQKFSTASTVNTEKVHPVLKKVDVDYVSDTDERFEVVSLKWDGKESIDSLLPTSSSSISKISLKDFDPRGDYKEVIDAVSEASNGADVGVWKVDVSSTRLEYWVVAGDKKEGVVVGFRAKAVES